MSTALPRPHVYIACAQTERAEVLARVLPEVHLHHAGTAEALLRDTHAATPDLVLLVNDLPSELPLAEILTILRSRPELVHTRWMAMGEQGLGNFVTAGVDALVAPTTPAVALALMIRTQLARVRQLRELEERARYQQQRLEAGAHEERVRDQLVHMLVHDLKNPISAVLGLLDVVLEDDERVPDDLAELLRLARDESQHLLHLAVNMLDVRKMQAGKMHLNRTFLFTPSLLDIIEQARGDVGAELGERELYLKLPECLSPLHADPEILRRILANLLSNAVKHTRRGGRLVLSVRELPSYVEWCLTDNGEGIPAEDIPRLFSAFEQSRLTLHSRFDTGMGLAFCKLAVEGHGGQIWVESLRGEGSSFYFTLPMVAEEEEDFVEVLQ
ncbi:sensor histidine kinase [Deinococcus peraridilitoris]|uniref:histidine kinase n=1 Tax=Deinococcus peraridilitoris (strain DSM 19664 / LMG 22246 / CIP 109416 / KR-200) TaxID=937777 RepID=L0A6V0_DEIPD|nr:HAMP domain-containing sensor histidine kinase [Deinococcus peraridilitoris]AFZ68765.1 histidine kinase [Deinococcus peraridilitoris DSM 19664]